MTDGRTKDGPTTYSQSGRRPSIGAFRGRSHKTREQSRHLAPFSARLDTGQVTASRVSGKLRPPSLQGYLLSSIGNSR